MCYEEDGSEQSLHFLTIAIETNISLTIMLLKAVFFRPLFFKIKMPPKMAPNSMEILLETVQDL